MARNLTYFIEPSSNVGDALALINSNLINLDITINNIQTILTEVSGMNSYFTDFSAKVPLFNAFINSISANKIIYSEAFATVSLLSAYWQNLIEPREFTVIYPVDVSIPLNTNNNPSDISKGSGLDILINNNPAESTALCLTFLNSQYPPINYSTGNLAKVAFPIYNNLQGANNPTIVNPGQAISLSNSVQNSVFYKPGLYLVGYIIETFQNYNYQWISISQTLSAFNV